MDGCISAAAPLAVADQLPLQMICKARLVWFPCKMRYIRIPGLALAENAKFRVDSLVPA